LHFLLGDEFMKKYITRLDILNYLDRCAMRMTKEELHGEIRKLKNFIEESDVAALREILS